MNLFTRIRSPTSNVGIIEPDGILKGSNRNERSRNTARITGNRPAVQSSHQGCISSRSRALRDRHRVDLRDALAGQFLATLGQRCASSCSAARWRCGRK